MDKGILKSFSFAVFCGVCAFNAAAGASLFSDYGQIQNVQNYSSNPFWSPGSPYNQKTPQPVYVQGTDLKSGECMNVVKSAVSVQCMTRDNCKNVSLADIRPSVMVQLSKLPNKNYVSACAGYIDSVFESYVAQYGNSVVNGGRVAFPNATAPANYADNNTIQIKNPYKVEPAKWQKEVKERKDELQELQEQNGLGTEDDLVETQFPSVYEDLSFAARVELQKEGYEPFKDMDSYIIPDFQDAGEWCMGEGKYSDFCQKKAQAEKDAKTPKKPLSGLCPAKKYNLATDHILKDIYAKDKGVAKQLATELIKCSTEANEVKVPQTDFVIEGFDEEGHYAVKVIDSDEMNVHNILFHAIGKESTQKKGVIADVFAGLCFIAGQTEIEIDSDSYYSQSFGDGDVGWAFSWLFGSAQTHNLSLFKCKYITNSQCIAFNDIFSGITGIKNSIAFKDNACVLTIDDATEHALNWW